MERDGSPGAPPPPVSSCCHPSICRPVGVQCVAYSTKNSPAVAHRHVRNARGRKKKRRKKKAAGDDSFSASHAAAVGAT